MKNTISSILLYPEIIDSSFQSEIENLLVQFPYCNLFYAGHAKSYLNTEKFPFYVQKAFTYSFSIDSLRTILSSVPVLLEEKTTKKEEVIKNELPLPQSISNEFQPNTEKFNQDSYLCWENQVGIIDRFLENKPTLPSNSQASIAQESVKTIAERVDSSTSKAEILTENYAAMLVFQYKYDKAKEVYQKLGIMYPQKKAYYEEKIVAIQKK